MIDFFRRLADDSEERSEIANYLIWGLVTVGVNFLAYFLCSLLFGIHYIISNIISWLIGVAFGYVVNKVYVFHSPDWSIRTQFKEFKHFAGIRLFIGILETILLKVFVSFLGYGDGIVKLFTGIGMIVTTYLYNKFVTFRPIDFDKEYEDMYDDDLDDDEPRNEKA